MFSIYNYGESAQITCFDILKKSIRETRENLLKVYASDIGRRDIWSH